MIQSNFHSTNAPVDSSPNAPTQKGNWVWIEDVAHAKRPRIDQVIFQRTLTLNALPTEATLHLCARLTYHLRLNGHVIGVGPVRSFPEFHEFDTYDLRNHLVKDETLIEKAAPPSLRIPHHTLREAHFLVQIR